MKVLVITGSAHKQGTTAALAEQFMAGAKAAGHEVRRFDAAYKIIHPCIACEKCHKTGDGCVFKDDMEELNPLLLSAEVIVFVSPVYYYTINAQIKAVIDRFYANDEALHRGKRAVLITAMADDTMESAEGANAAFQGMTGYLEWEIAGIINGAGCGDAEDLKKTGYLNQAYEMGKKL